MFLFDRQYAFLILCGVVFAIFAANMPPYFPLLQPDSDSYISFSPVRTSLYPLFLAALTGIGLRLEQISYVQILILALALIVLLGALSRAGVPRFVLATLSVILGASSYFSTFSRTIMTESLFCSFMMCGTAFLIDYFRAGKVTALAWAGFFAGIAVAIRPAGLPFAAMIFVAARLGWTKRRTSAIRLAIALVVPVSIGPIAERFAYQLKHGDTSDSLASIMLIGKGALLIRNDTTFTGRHEAALTPLGRQLYEDYVPVHHFLARVPLGAAPSLTASYEVLAQYHALRTEANEAAKKYLVSSNALFSELGTRAIESNVAGYLRLSLLYYAGAWSVASLTFPPTARALTAYTAANPAPFANLIENSILNPPQKLASYIVYPAFLTAGLVTLLLSVALIPFLIWPALRDGQSCDYFVMAAFTSASCQAYSIFLCLMNPPTPRYILACYPQILLVGLFLAMALRLRLQHGLKN